ncbi:MULTISPECIES: hypothetical protein [Mycolicibacterium]|uniref:Recombinase n=2 Tax=Mycolicibacterium TaxID=1866885 RepID=A0ABM7I3V4_MYCME|nr:MULTISPECIES: hypothetical protein [Mycolicibacterium]MCC9185476.1 recombinase [Mycolicibacterium mageritense]MCV7210765.1 recombinase [Mycolicibacterium canariasense]ORV18605.1 hypothetical protein AWB94_33215 [Mycolicibacterium canariasense]BBX37581.1 hypothetical protein MMAGJ_68630 [Mycolicibacterium mageritense]GAS93226.1 putative recombinase [Mycolicibacterium canariasense]
MAVNRREQAVWGLFADWCAAHEQPPLPAAPLTLARFLAENPATVASQRRRVGVVNAVHRRRGHRPPGHVETVRELIDSRRRGTVAARADAAAAALARLPRRGWPTALFARRDAMLLTLAAAAVPYTRIASLRLGDIDSDQRGDTVSVTCPDGTAYTATTPAIDASPVSVWEEWREIRGLQHQFPSPRIVAAHLRGQQVRNAAAAPVHLPLFTPIDRWGDCGLAPTALTPAAVSAILAPHLEGTALPHAPLPAPEAHRARRPAPRAEPAPVPETVMTLDPETFGRGLAARRRAATDLAGVTDVLDDVEDRASRLLDDLLRLLDDPDPGAQR